MASLNQKAAGLNDAQAQLVTQAAIDQQLEYGLTGDMVFPNCRARIICGRGGCEWN